MACDSILKGQTTEKGKLYFLSLIKVGMCARLEIIINSVIENFGGGQSRQSGPLERVTVMVTVEERKSFIVKSSG